MQQRGIKFGILQNSYCMWQRIALTFCESTKVATWGSRSQVLYGQASSSSTLKPFYITWRMFSSALSNGKEMIWASTCDWGHESCRCGHPLYFEWNAVLSCAPNPSRIILASLLSPKVQQPKNTFFGQGWRVACAPSRYREGYLSHEGIIWWKLLSVLHCTSLLELCCTTSWFRSHGEAIPSGSLSWSVGVPFWMVRSMNFDRMYFSINLLHSHIQDNLMDVNIRNELTPLP